MDFLLSILLLELCAVSVGLLVLLATVLFWFVALFDCLGSKHPDKLIWFLVILTLNAFGAAAWFLYAKKQIAVAPSLTAPRAPLPARIGQTYTRGYAPPPNDPSRHYPTPKRIRKHKQSLTKWHILAISIWSILLGMCSCLTIIIIAANWNNPTLR